MSIQLNFVNRSNDTNNSQIVIFQGSPDGNGSGDSVEAPLLVHRVFALPPVGGQVSVDYAGASVALGVAPAAIPGEVLPPSSLPTAPVQLSLPDAPAATILVKGGGTAPVFFVVSADEPHAPVARPAVGFPGSLLAAVRRLWRMIAGNG